MKTYKEFLEEDTNTTLYVDTARMMKEFNNMYDAYLRFVKAKSSVTQALKSLHDPKTPGMERDTFRSLENFEIKTGDFGKHKRELEKIEKNLKRI